MLIHLIKKNYELVFLFINLNFKYVLTFYETCLFGKFQDFYFYFLYISPFCLKFKKVNLSFIRI